MACEHGEVGAPVLEADQHTHTYLVDSGLSHAVKTVDTPVKYRLHAFGVIVTVVGLVICFLKTHHAVEPAVCESFILFSAHGAYLDSEIVEVGASSLEHFFDIIGSVDFGVFA